MGCFLSIIGKLSLTNTDISAFSPGRRFLLSTTKHAAKVNKPLQDLEHLSTAE